MTLESHHLTVWLIIGFVAGTLAGRVVAGGGFGCLANTAVGLAGAFIGGVLLSLVSPNRAVDTYGVIGDVVVSFVGAALLLGILRLLRPRQRWQRPRR
ncbi:MAG: GlsB/YeaQ/YmgE family stress response membrane protein [Candidatus Dormibacteraeota bacterium]|uniref:GlsB/YeaQ/YmgE family stress response membrane protein n=1 Tax=Candidatus Amunia macphersoniae TaxID=3127014 RepID=A0A934NH54_9BACT|nr:GlsB/YeaQ/YmgE family stress response membrane protein [Candidatus Dormibacteraeota bacterium]